MTYWGLNRKVIPILLNRPPDTWVKTFACIIGILGDRPTHLGRRDIQQRRVHEHDGRGSGNRGIRQGSRVYGIAWSRIDEQAVVTHDFIGLIPVREAIPIVGSDDEDKITIRVRLPQGFEGMYHVRRTRQMELKIADSQMSFPSYCKACQMQASIVIQQSRRRLQRILRRHQKPEFFQIMMTHQPLTEGGVALMDGIEAAAVDSSNHKK